jgi:hypothetical protein
VWTRKNRTATFYEGPQGIHSYKCLILRPIAFLNIMTCNNEKFCIKMMYLLLINYLRNCGKVQVFWNESNKSVMKKLRANYVHSQNACYRLAHNFWSRLITRRNVEIKIYEITKFPVSFNGCESWHNACYRLAHNFCSRLITRRNVEIKIYETTKFPVSFNGCESWSLVLKGETQINDNG